MASVALVAAACIACGGGDDSPDDATSDAAGDTDQLQDEGDAPDESADSGEEAAASSASIDPATMPGIAEAVVTVDGETLMYAPPDPTDTRLFTCDLATDRITVNMQTPEGRDLLVQVGPLESGEWAGSVVAKDPDSDRNYQGAGPYAADAFAVDGSHLVFVGPFEYYLSDDPANFVDAGEARIAVTCP